MGAFRELVYGVLFFVFALAGSFTIGPLLYVAPIYLPRWWWGILAIATGATIGGGSWLWIKYKFLTPPPK